MNGSVLRAGFDVLLSKVDSGEGVSSEPFGMIDMLDSLGAVDVLSAVLVTRGLCALAGNR